jgi:hypothetical protein
MRPAFTLPLTTVIGAAILAGCGTGRPTYRHHVRDHVHRHPMKSEPRPIAKRQEPSASMLSPVASSPKDREKPVKPKAMPPEKRADMVVRSASTEAKQSPADRQTNDQKAQRQQDEMAVVVSEEPRPGEQAETSNPANSTATDLPTTTGAKFGHARDYSWLRGQLVRVHTHGGHWEIRFAEIHEANEYGGRFVLSGKIPTELREGDSVEIRGRVLGEDRWLHGASYRVDLIRPMETQMARPPADPMTR